MSAGRSRLLVDLGWPGQIGALLANLQRKGIPIGEVRHGLATHYHLDHAGADQDLKRLGMRLIVTPEQIEAIPAMKRWSRPEDHYTDITLHDNTVVPTGSSRELLALLGFAGEIVRTPGHSPDSVTLVLDNGWAFTGDLTSESMVGPEDPAVVARSWQALRDRGATAIHSGHGPIRPIPPALAR